MALIALAERLADGPLGPVSVDAVPRTRSCVAILGLKSFTFARSTSTDLLLGVCTGSILWLLHKTTTAEGDLLTIALSIEEAKTVRISLTLLFGLA